MLRTTFLLACAVALFPSVALAQIDWVSNLEEGLSMARDRDAPIVALLWDYN